MFETRCTVVLCVISLNDSYANQKRTGPYTETFLITPKINFTPKLLAVIRLHGAQGDTNFQSLKKVKRLTNLSSIRIIPVFSNTSPEIKLLVVVSKCSLWYWQFLYLTPILNWRDPKPSFTKWTLKLTKILRCLPRIGVVFQNKISLIYSSIKYRFCGNYKNPVLRFFAIA